MTYNNAEYGKLLSGPLWVEILANMAPFVPSLDINTDVQSKLRQPPPKLALFSAHDTTLHMLMASLGKDLFDGQTFAPFASYVNIELHEISFTNTTPTELVNYFPTKTAFRFIYNGQVLTSKVEGCDSDLITDLCDISKLAKVLKPFALLERDCDVSDKEKDDDDDKKDDENDSNKTKEDQKSKSKPKGYSGNVMLFTSFLSGIVGSLVTYYYIHKRLPCRGRVRIRQYDVWDRNIVTGGHRADTELPDLS